MKKLVTYLQSTNRSSIALAILRIFICLHLLKKIILEWRNMELIYGPTSIISHLPMRFGQYVLDSTVFREHFHLLLTCYILVILLFFFGIGKNITNVILMAFLILFQRLDWLILNGGDNLLFFLVLYLTFANSFDHFAISKPSLKRESTRRLVNLLSNLAAYSIMFQFCLIYIVSAMHKLHADVWFNGIAVYYTFMLDRFRGTPLNNALARNEFFVTFSTYFTVFFEMYFPVLVFVKKLKPYLVMMGLALHMGIYVFMMIYDFQFVFIFSYIIFFSDEELLSYKQRFIDPISEKFRSKKEPSGQVLPN
ncbi:MAG: HTTM domain-containing protein [Chitinophaga sp.]|uniref:HTTM domain-containing protein n=1 Tax=Chitinophaga sp. TaxID=1869181 RepID=UPI001B29481F|nr:HTTM domain-containing protein [Chitinophaga sp.]MBO9729509.1 HTTM domain-containing protein [Chitinophaga sp.]